MTKKQEMKKTLINLTKEQLIEEYLDLVEMAVDSVFEKKKPLYVSIMGVEFRK